MKSSYINPFSDITDKAKRDAIVKILSLLHTQDQTLETLLHAIGSGNSSEYLLREMQMFGLVQPGSEDGYLTISERGEFALDGMQ